MQGFAIIKDDRDKGFSNLPISSLALSIGDLIEVTAGSTAWAKTTSSTNFFTRKAIVMETTTTDDSDVLAIELDGSEIVKAESGSNSSTDDNGDRMALTDENTVNNSGTDDSGQAVAFVQYGTIGAASDKVIYGKVLVGSGVDPDAS